ncbi:hypothetical protein [Cupriavidus metallidurans]|uniref:hypothetical protein n=1 Tax=Cupriavidus metallidurans TaxID=119219 RepID=UPI001645FCF5|nr:hypothetical protein [Cupriavidus metallidurans]
MAWEKAGLLYVPQSAHPKLTTHASNPLPVWLHGDVYRVYFSGRDESNRSSVGFADIDVVRGTVEYEHDRPVFIHGEQGTFYSHGVSIGNCYEAGGKRYILFMGWQCPDGAHWLGEVGCLHLSEDWSLHLDSDTPFMALDNEDPVSLSYPWVHRKQDGMYRMWYGSTKTWDAGNDEMVHIIKGASSQDGRAWHKTGTALPFALGVAQAFSRPTVIVDDLGYHMWFSYRPGGNKSTYRIGYATSEDGDAWTLRLDEAGIDVSTSGWDSEMIEYPYVFEHQGRRLMMYNGNGYGKSGIGLAVYDGPR